MHAKLARLGVARGGSGGKTAPSAAPPVGASSTPAPRSAPGVAASGSAAPTWFASLPEGVRERLRRAATQGAAVGAAGGGFGVTGLPRGDLVVRAAGKVLVTTWSTPRASLHGDHALDASFEGRAAVAAASARDARFLGIPPESWAFFDTETTSLNAGAGVWVFLVGVGRFVGEDFRVRQYFLLGPDGERAFLDAVAEELSSAQALVSFHGKSFDAPRLDDRRRLAAEAALCAGRPHWDLLPAARRVFGAGRPNCRLQTLEADLLGFRRRDDLPGSECPAQYFAYLRGGRHRLDDVMEHNRLDTVSLTTLAGVLTGEYERLGSDPASALAVGLDWAAAGRVDRAKPALLRGVPAALVGVRSARDRARRWLRRFGEGGAAETLNLPAGARLADSSVKAQTVDASRATSTAAPIPPSAAGRGVPRRPSARI